MFKLEDIEGIVKASVKESFNKAGLSNAPKNSTLTEGKVEIPSTKDLLKTKLSSLKEALILTPRSFLLKTEYLSAKTKQAHESLYNGYVTTFNKVSSMLDAASTQDAAANSSPIRSLKLDEQYNLNGAKLHDLYFTNISDITSQIATDSIPFMRLTREFGSFDRWQFDFIACAMAAREGWAVVYFEPYKNVYMNCIVDGHSTGIPLGGIPVLVLDMWSHAYYRDYLDDKKSYINAMMREVNWNVVEARMIVAERANLDSVFKIAPVINSAPERILQRLDINSPPIEKDQVTSSEIVGTQVGSQSQPNKPNLPIMEAGNLKPLGVK